VLVHWGQSVGKIYPYKHRKNPYAIGFACPTVTVASGEMINRKITHGRGEVTTFFKKILLSFFFISVLCLTTGDIEYLFAAAGKTGILAEVNGEAINESALSARVKAIHRQKPAALRGEEAGNIAIGEIVQSMIDERLMVQEARRAELETTPDFVKRLESFVTTQSVLRLRQEEVLDKVRVSDEKALEYFKEGYEKKGRSDQEAFERMKRRITKRLEKEQKKELSESFVTQLKKKADVWVDQDLIAHVDLKQDYTGNTEVIARVDNQAIPLSEFVGELKQEVRRKTSPGRGKERQIGKEKLKALKEGIIERLVTYRVIEREALRRDYMRETAFLDMVEKRKAVLLVDAFKGQLVYPLAIPSQKDLMKYYNEHIDEFKKGYEVWIQEMRFQDKAEAEKILRELQQGASFEFLAAQVLGGSLPKKDTVWVPVDRFAPVIRTAIIGLKVGEVSDVISHGRKYKIIKLKGKRGGETLEFSKVEERLERLAGREKFEKVLSEYLSRLRKASDIKIYENRLRKIEDEYWKGFSWGN
jgi:parvulin-like peptidyl-prolyl isomerase